MSMYEILMSNKELYEEVSEMYFKMNEVEMGIFYRNVALGYKIKAEKLSLKDAAAA